MMKKVNSILAVVLSSVLAASCLSGCGGSGNTESSAGTTTAAASGTAAETSASTEAAAPSSAAETSAAETTAAEAESDVVDLNGREIVLFASGTRTFYLDTDEYVDENALGIQARAKEMEEKYNCKFNVVIGSGDDQLPSLRTSAMSGRPFADMMELRTMDTMAAYREGLLMPLNTVFNESDWSEFSTNYIKGDDGSFYGIGPIRSTSTGCYMFFNKDHFEAQGIDVKALYQEALEGKWTWDRFMEIAEQAAVIKDGVTEVYGSEGPSARKPGFEQYLWTFGAETLIKNEDQTLSSGLRTENMRKAMDKLVEMTEKGKDFLYIMSTKDRTAVPREMFYAGQLAMIYGASMGDLVTIVNNSPFEVGALPTPTPEVGDTVTYGGMNTTVWVMPLCNENDMETTKAIADMMTYIYGGGSIGDIDEYLYQSAYDTYAPYCGDEEMLELIMKVATDKRGIKLENSFVAGLSDQWGKTLKTPLIAIQNGETSFEAGIDSCADAWQAIIDEYNSSLQ